MTEQPRFGRRVSVWPVPSDDLYDSPPPWEIGRPQPAFKALAESGQLTGRVLDVGCGTGEHTLMAAGLGLSATGIDLAAGALATAERKATERGLAARFIRLDARNLADLGEQFDTVLDSGLFHLVGDADRTAFVAGLHAVLLPGGRYFMLGFSDEQPGFGEPGPHRLTRAEITEAFGEGWRIDSLERTMIDVIVDPEGIHAWLLSATRI